MLSTPLEGPFWLTVSISIVAFILVNAPKLLEVWEKTRVFNREYEHQKKELELLKLRYEIEVLRKDNQIEDWENKSQNLSKPSEKLNESDNPPPRSSGKSAFSAILGGLLGAGIYFLFTPTFSSLLPGKIGEPVGGPVLATNIAFLIFSGGFSGWWSTFLTPKKYGQWWLVSFLAGTIYSFATNFIVMSLPQR